MLFDNNVWRYLVDNDGIEVVHKAARKAHVQIVAAPAVLYEILGTEDRDLRHRLVKVVTRQCWSRPMTEIFQKAEELRFEITRLRPEWLRVDPDRRAWHQLRADWSGKNGFWARARAAPDLEASRISGIGDRFNEQARSATMELRTEARKVGLSFEAVDLGEMVRLTAPIPGWDGSRFEPWRLSGAQEWEFHLFSEGSRAVYREWLGPWVDLRALLVDQASWVRFWLHDVDRTAMPLHWLQWAVSLAQATRKTGHGSAVDKQISLYLPGADLFVTGDRTFAQIIGKLRPSSPVPLAREHVVPAGPAAAEAIVSIINQV